MPNNLGNYTLLYKTFPQFNEYANTADECYYAL